MAWMNKTAAVVERMSELGDYAGTTWPSCQVDALIVADQKLGSLTVGYTGRVQSTCSMVRLTAWYASFIAVSLARRIVGQSAERCLAGEPLGPLRSERFSEIFVSRV